MALCQQRKTLEIQFRTHPGPSSATRGRRRPCLPKIHCPARGSATLDHPACATTATRIETQHTHTPHNKTFSNTTLPTRFQRRHDRFPCPSSRIGAPEPPAGAPCGVLLRRCVPDGRGLRPAEQFAQARAQQSDRTRGYAPPQSVYTPEVRRSNITPLVALLLGCSSMHRKPYMSL